MQRFALGGFSVFRVGLGAMQLPGPGVFGPPRDRAGALAVLRRAVELGVDHIDTAQYYGPDVANEQEDFGFLSSTTARAVCSRRLASGSSGPREPRIA